MRFSLSAPKYRKVAGLEVNGWPDSTGDFNIVVLERKKNAVSIAKKAVSGSLDDLNDQLKKIPIVLLISGKGIVIKEAEGETDDWDRMLQIHLPNARSGDFAGQTYKKPKGCWLVIARLELIRNLLEEFEKRKLKIIGLHISELAVDFALPVLKAEAKAIQTGNAELEWSAEGVERYTKTNEASGSSLQVGNEMLEGRWFPAFSAAFQKIARIECRQYNLEVLEACEMEFAYTRAYQKAGLAGLIVIFALLLINTLLFFGLSDKNSRLEAELVVHRQQLAELDKLKAEWNEKNAVLKGNMALSASKTSYFADEVGRSMPTGIQLTELIVFPPKPDDDRGRYKEEFFAFDQELLLVKGRTLQALALNQWIKDLDKLPWVAAVAMSPYSEGADGTGTFELKITLK